MTLDFLRRGKFNDNGFIESVNFLLRDETLNEHWFRTIADARSSSSHGAGVRHGASAQQLLTRSSLVSFLGRKVAESALHALVGSRRAKLRWENPSQTFLRSSHKVVRHVKLHQHADQSSKSPTPRFVG